MILSKEKANSSPFNLEGPNDLTSTIPIASGDNQSVPARAFINRERPRLSDSTQTVLAYYLGVDPASRVMRHAMHEINAVINGHFSRDPFYGGVRPANQLVVLTKIDGLIGRLEQAVEKCDPVTLSRLNTEDDFNVIEPAHGRFAGRIVAIRRTVRDLKEKVEVAAANKASRHGRSKETARIAIETLADIFHCRASRTLRGLKYKHCLADFIACATKRGRIPSPRGEKGILAKVPKSLRLPRTKSRRPQGPFLQWHIPRDLRPSRKAIRGTP